MDLLYIARVGELHVIDENVVLCTLRSEGTSYVNEVVLTSGQNSLIYFQVDVRHLEFKT